MMRNDFENPFGLKTTKGKTRMMSSLLDSGVFPGTQGGPLENIIGAKAIAFGEALSDDYMNYVMQVKKNAIVMAEEFIKKNYHLISGGTDNHLMLIDLRSKEVTGKSAEEALGKAEITVNKNMVPFDTQSPFITSGIRVGTAAMTTRGFKEDDMIKIVNYIDEVISNISNDAYLASIKTEINKWAGSYPLFK
jgi:glycine hydroxymethyltransferase